MKHPKVLLSPLSETLAICRLSSRSAIPLWALSSDFFSLTRTSEELSIVCPQASVPSDIQCERDWRCVKVQGPIDFATTGVLASLTEPLAQAQISFFAISTYDTDYVLVKEENLNRALHALKETGHEIV